MESVIINMLGHVDHGKTTLTKALTGKWTDTFKEEAIRGISIKLGYADMGIYEFKDGYWKEEKKGNENGKLVKIVSVLDSPGHESLMATAISASSVIDGALLLIAANEQCPQEQTKEHLAILELLKINNVIIVQTKIDVVSKQRAIESYKEIKAFVKGTIAENAPIIPVSATYNINIDKLIEAIAKHIKPRQKEEYKISPLFYALRTFDINKPGTHIKDLVGGVFGGVVASGSFKVNDEIIVAPFPEKKDHIIETYIKSIRGYDGYYEEAKPGITLAIATGLDPALTKADRLAGSIITLKENKDKIKITDEIYFNYELLQRHDIPNVPIRENEILLINIAHTTNACTVMNVKKGIVNVKLKRPIVYLQNQKIAIQRRIGQRWRLAGIGKVI
ncbi:MAG: translation initiation factor IF-2 subunit gamma [Candidatus Anstonellales archaeon]